MAGEPAKDPAATPAPSEPQAPAGAPAPSTPDAGASPPAEGGSAQPAKPAEPAEGKKEPQFPWSEKRKLENENRRYAAELQRAQEAAKQFEAERAKWTQTEQSLQQRARDYDALADVLRKNPDLADALDARITAGGTRAAAAQTGLPKEFLDEFKAMRDQVAQLSQGYTKQQELQQLAQQRQEMERTGQQLKSQISTFLAEKKYSPKLAPHAEAFVLEWARNQGAEMSDIPLILNEWYADQEENRRAWMENLRAASEPGKALPPVPGGGASAPITGKPDFGALDGKTARVLQNELETRLGWGKKGAA